jgi:opacity protein-like surface antigen
MKKILIVAALALTLAPSTARAEWLLTPFAGGNTGGIGQGEFTFGASVGWMGDGIFGFEADLGFIAKNNVFDTEESGRLGIDRDFFEAKGGSFMGNVLVGYPFGGTNGNFNPYIVGGLGWIRSKVETSDDLFESTNDEFGMDLGGGIFAFVNESWGFRGDMRWFYMFDAPDDLEFDLLDAGLVNRVDVPTIDLVDIDIDRHFWRATGGVTYRW